MDIHTAAQYMKLGYRIRRTSWGQDEWLEPDAFWDKIPVYQIYLTELLATDWEIITTGIITDFPITYYD
jgi:hypothetical protein